MSEQHKVQKYKVAWEKYQDNDKLTAEQLNLLYHGTKDTITFLDGLDEMEDVPPEVVVTLRNKLSRRGQLLMAKMYYAGMIDT